MLFTHTWGNAITQTQSDQLCFFNRGDPTLVKTNVAITTGYLISGKRNIQFTQVMFVKVRPKIIHAIGNKLVRCDKPDASMTHLSLGPTVCASCWTGIHIFRWSISSLQHVFIYLKCCDHTSDMLSLFPLYFCFPDLLLIFYYWKAIGDKFFVVHHLAALYAYYYVLVSALLSNSRTCRQDGKETTKGEQLCPVELGVLTNLATVQ